MDSPTIRPALLTALCFLTFMSSIAGLWNQSTGLWNPEIVAEQTKEKFELVYEQLPKKTQSKEEREMIDKMFASAIAGSHAANITRISLITVLFESLMLFAAYLMWNLDKRGFYLYLGAMALMLIAPLLFIGGMFCLIMALSGILLSFFMCIFYAFHLKYMH